MRESDTVRVMGKMKTFERAKKAEIREAFVRSRTRSNKYKPEEAEAIRNYILSDECVRDIERALRAREAKDFVLAFVIKDPVDGRIGLVFNVDADMLEKAVVRESAIADVVDAFGDIGHGYAR